ncbi:hypothetical protein DMB95_02330 [Campylobacter sp. MIT 12-8780]|uniref:S8 family serine peptidase n=1 Tax=unclassified Campylobacter TaxID=2593542 RepID=UPI00115F5ACB|nr:MULTISPECIES: S8 family serine peptidase [unclassified Campylobacter]NDJ26701.1 S8 family serine peptidase [Campylobacter sp. MIT 19-121]TQR42475.1 hypothetical protein DMB95_02330 [Campylobacter sp. MIT 12-8780]
MCLFKRAWVLFFVFTLKLFALSPFELHNVNEAHQSGITGNGIHISILDDAFNITHQSLKDRILGSVAYPSDQNGQSYTPNFLIDTHGSHVAGIALGSRLGGSEPYGAAYNASFYGVGIFGDNTHTNLPDIYNILKNKGEVKIVNNSWGSNIYPVVGFEYDLNKNLVQNTSIIDDANYAMKELTNPLAHTSGLYKLAQERKLLSIFAAGNEGVLSPNIQSVLPRYDESIRSWLAVGALDSEYITRQADGKLIIDGKGVADFSNGFKGAVNFSLTAAGVKINSVDANTNNSYTLKQGTSMAAPLVSGVAALVQEKFPFLNGAQIADVLLSTANKDYQAPKMVVKSIGEGSGASVKTTYTLVYIDQAVPATDAEKRADVDVLYNGLALNIGGVLQNYTDYIMNNLNTTQAAQQVSKEEIFGQGILDAQKALQGLSILDTNRLNLKDIQTHDNKQQAFYTLDTQGHTAEFSNDISQKTWDSNLHLSSALNSPAAQMQNITEVGLIKEGQGSLILSGTNSYQGDTIVRGGTLALYKRNDGSGGSLQSSVFVEQGGTLFVGERSDLNTDIKRLASTFSKAMPSTSSVILNQNLHNNGLLDIGGNGLAVLEVKGAYTQASLATLRLSFNTSGNSLLQANNYNIAQGASLVYVPIIAQISPSAQNIALNLGDLKHSLSQFNVSVANSSVFDFTLSPDKLVLNASTKANVYANYEGANASLARALRAMAMSGTLPASYTQFFGELNAMANNDYVKTLESIDNNDHLKNTARIRRIQERLGFENILLLLQENSEQISLNPSYTYVDDESYDGYGVGSKLEALKYVDERTFLAGFLNYAYNYSDFENSYIKAHLLSTGFTFKSDLDFVNVVSGVSLGFARNQLRRNIYNQDSRPKASYNNLLSSFHAGISKDLLLDEKLSFALVDSTLKLSPMIYGAYTFMYQDEIKENKALLSVNHKNKNYHSLSMSVGTNLSYTLSDAYDLNPSSGFNLFAFYEQRLLGNVLKNSASFYDFTGSNFNLKHKLDKSLIRIGANVRLGTDKTSFLLGFDDEISKNSNNINFNIKAQYQF